MAEYLLDTDLIAKLIFRLLPHDPPFRLAMDRTNWKFGQQDINVLVIGVVYHGVAFPLLFQLLPKFGNSNTNERIELIERYPSVWVCFVGLLDCRSRVCRGTMD